MNELISYTYEDIDDIELYALSIQVKNLGLIYEGIMGLCGRESVAIPIRLDKTGQKDDSNFDYMTYWYVSIYGEPAILGAWVSLYSAGGALSLTIKKTADPAIVYQSKQIMSKIVRNFDKDSFNSKMVELYNFMSASPDFDKEATDFYGFLKDANHLL